MSHWPQIAYKHALGFTDKVWLPSAKAMRGSITQTCVFNAVQTSRCLLTVDPSALTVIKKRKREPQDNGVSHQAEGNKKSKHGMMPLQGGVVTHQPGDDKDIRPATAAKTSNLVLTQQAAVASLLSDVVDAPQAGDDRDHKLAVTPIITDAAVIQQAASRKDCMPANAITMCDTISLTKDKKALVAPIAVSQEAAGNQSSKPTAVAIISNDVADQQAEGTKDSKPAIAPTTTEVVVKQQAEGIKDVKPDSAPITSDVIVSLKAGDIKHSKPAVVPITSKGVAKQQAERIQESKPDSGPIMTDDIVKLQAQDIKDSKPAVAPITVEGVAKQQAERIQDSKPDSGPFMTDDIVKLQAQDIKDSKPAVAPITNEGVAKQQAEGIQDSKPAVAVIMADVTVLPQAQDSKPITTPITSDISVSQQPDISKTALTTTADPPGKTVPSVQYSLEHYKASLLQMQAGGYPLPIQTKDGKEVLPLAFVASHQTGKHFTFVNMTNLHSVATLCCLSSICSAHHTDDACSTQVLHPDGSTGDCCR